LIAFNQFEQQVEVLVLSTTQYCGSNKHFKPVEKGSGYRYACGS